MADECWSISFLRSSSFLQFIRVQLMATWHVKEVHNRSDHGQVEKTGVGWKIDMLHMFHPRPADRTRLQLHGTALTAHSVATGTEGRVDLPLTAQHAEHGLLQLTQLLLEHSGLLAAEAFTATAVHAFRGLERRVWRARVASRNQVHDAGIVQGPPGMVIDLL